MPFSDEVTPHLCTSPSLTASAAFSLSSVTLQRLAALPARVQDGSTILCDMRTCPTAVPCTLITLCCP